MRKGRPLGRPFRKIVVVYEHLVFVGQLQAEQTAFLERRERATSRVGWVGVVYTGRQRTREGQLRVVTGLNFVRMFLP